MQMKQAQSHLFTGWRASAVWRENRLSWKKNNLASPELALTLPSQVSNQPMGVEGILRGHPPAHDGIEEGFPLAGVEPQDLGILEETAWDSPQWRKHCMSQKWELSEKSLQIIAQLGTIYRMKNDRSTHNIMYTVQSPDMMKGVGGRRGEKRGERERGESWSDTDSAAWQAVPGCFRSQLTVFHPGPRDFHFSHIYFLLQILLVSSVFSY